MTCTNYELAEEYGKDSKGIWAKLYDDGMNACSAEDADSIYICHDLNEEQSLIVLDTLKKYFNVDWDLSASDCIVISNL